MVKRKFDELKYNSTEVIYNNKNNKDNKENEDNEFYYKIKNIKDKNLGISTEFDSNFFEEASKAWNSNKIKKENVTYVYKCTFRNHKKVRCNRELYEYELNSKNKPYKENCNHFCKIHINKKYNPEIHTFC